MNCCTARKVSPVRRWFLGQADTKVAVTVSPSLKPLEPTSSRVSPKCFPAQASGNPGCRGSGGFKA